MAYSFTVTKVRRGIGQGREVIGTFTSAVGDGEGSLGPSVHGLNVIDEQNISLDPGAIDVQRPKVSVSGGTITFTYQDTQGLSGRFVLKGRG